MDIVPTMENLPQPQSLPFLCKSTGDGLALLGSILWLDSRKSGDLSFVSSAATKVTSDGPQIITTEESLKIIETSHKAPKTLVCQYNRPVSIGRLKLELLPTGSALGGASLFIQWLGKRILYAPELQIEKIPIVRKLQLKKADILILGTKHSEPNLALPPRKREKMRLLKIVKNYLETGAYPMIFCEPTLVAPELIKLFSENKIPTAAHHSIHKIVKVYERYGNTLGSVHCYDPNTTQDKVAFLPISQNGRWNYLRKAIFDQPILYVEESYSPTAGVNALNEVDDRFVISRTCSGKDFKDIIQAVSPKEVFFFGPYAKRYVEEFKHSHPNIRPLYENGQPTLF